MYQAKMKVRKKRRKRNKGGRLTLGGILLRILVWIPAIAIVISYISIYINPQVFWVPMFFGLYFVPIFIINLLFLLLLIFRRKALLLVPLVALLPSLIFADRFVKVGNEEESFDGSCIKVMTYNVGRYSAGKGMTREESIDGIRSFIRDEHPDVVCIQEFMTSDSSNMYTLLPDYPYHTCHLFKGNNHFGNVTLSKYPIRNSQSITFSKSTNLCVVSDIELDDTVIRVFNCHLESYALSFLSLVKRLSDKDQFKGEFLEMHEHIKEATIRRADQVAAVMDNIAGSEYPSILCGDFNDTPVSYAYHQLQKRKTDSFVASGKGFGSTYSVLWPVLRIDYILLPSQFGCSMHEVTRIQHSDHYPVSTIIYVQPQGQPVLK